MLQALTKNWWVVVLQGVLLILFAILLFAKPGLSALSLAIWFAALLAVDGLFTLITTLSNWKQEEERWLLVIYGLLSIALGVLLFRAPEVTELFMALTFAFWFIFSGIARIAIAIQLRKEMTGEGWLILGGVLSVLFGIILFAMPGLSLATFLMTAAFFALIAGIMLVMGGFKLRKGEKWLEGKTA